MQGNFSDMKHRADRERQRWIFHVKRPSDGFFKAIFVQDKWLADESHKQRLGSNLV